MQQKYTTNWSWVCTSTKGNTRLGTKNKFIFLKIYPFLMFFPIEKSDFFKYVGYILLALLQLADNSGEYVDVVDSTPKHGFGWAVQ